VPRRRAWAASLLVALVGCSSGSSTSSTTTAAATTTTAAARPPTTAARATTTIRTTTTTRVAASTTTRAATTTTTAQDPTTTVAPGPPTTQPPAAPCPADTLLAAAELAFGPLPQGAMTTDPRCVESWATAVLEAPGQDRAFAVFNNPEGEWIGRNIGTDQVCSAAGVPVDFYGPLGCGPWEG
jgi:hypothetical protein